jgi:hypothetical protein
MGRDPLNHFGAVADLGRHTIQMVAVTFECQCGLVTVTPIPFHAEVSVTPTTCPRKGGNQDLGGRHSRRLVAVAPFTAEVTG